MKIPKSILLLPFLSAPFLSADVTLPSVIGSHMVLQRDEPVPIWGWAEPKEEITVEFNGHKVKATAGGNKDWKVELPASKANSKGQKLTITGNNKIVLEDVLVGEVWLCSGQSNMEWTVSRSTNSKEEIAAGDHPLIRHIKVPHRPSDKPESDVNTSGWQICSPNTVANFTAVGYFFGRHIHSELNVPVGLLGSNWGGTRIDPWIPPVGYRAIPSLKENFADKLDQFPSKNAQGKVNHQTPLALYNGMIAPLVPYGIRGAIWYQGESNNGEGMLYHEKMKALISGWRSLWNKEGLPFYYVQLAPFKYRGQPDRLPGIWQAQLATLSVPHTGMAVTTDITTTNNIHPPNKQDVGKRLALWALAKDYGKKDIVYTGPLFDKVEAKGAELVVHFQNGTAKGLKTTDCQKASHFEVAGKDGGWKPAIAKVTGETIVLTSEEVKEPVSARFAWDQLAEPNLFNGAGLPASPFNSTW
jgi:sialate O-acetylesterase